MSNLDPPRPLLHRKKSSLDLRRESNDVLEIIKAYGSRSSTSSSTSTTKAAVEFWEKMVKEDEKDQRNVHRRTSHDGVSMILDRDAVPGAAPDDEEIQQRRPTDLAVTLPRDQRRKTSIPSPIQLSGSPRSSPPIHRTANRPYSPTKLVLKKAKPEEEEQVAIFSETENFKVSFCQFLPCLSPLGHSWGGRWLPDHRQVPPAHFTLPRSITNARHNPLFQDESIKEVEVGTKLNKAFALSCLLVYNTIV
ncbi:hypothetical protein AC578_7334 [Pseudocercospora eumusae]|uniref:Uncharacterized protein n=1 Tax=Pseudocercospora eumusae TaxID=321146 RepID=A0A139HWT0_9PEZI|nr:hypothetical protein AC578_7334 [Pseudocercospora eumusae]